MVGGGGEVVCGSRVGEGVHRWGHGGGLRGAGARAELDAEVATVVVVPLAGARGGEAKLDGDGTGVEDELQGPEGWEGRLQRLVLVHGGTRGVELGREEVPLLAGVCADDAPVKDEAHRLGGLALEADGVNTLGVGLDRGDELAALGKGDGDEVGHVPHDGCARSGGGARPRGSGARGRGEGALSKSGIDDPAGPDEKGRL